MEWFIGILCTFAVLIVGAALYSDHQGVLRKRKLMMECMKDGHKEYECESMLRSNRSYVPIPIFMPIIR